MKWGVRARNKIEGKRREAGAERRGCDFGMKQDEEEEGK